MTVIVAGVAVALPERVHTTAVGFVFLAATWAMVWRKDDETVRRAGLALGGVVMPGDLRVREVARSAGTAIAWAAGLFALVVVPFYFGWRWWWAPKLAFSLAVKPLDVANEALGQLVVIALPEEAFYRGYLQSRLDEAWAPRWRVLGANVGPAIVVVAAVFAVGHLATIRVPTRLAVFFPALLFGWLRARTGGIGAGVVFHALCNVYSQGLGRGYGEY